MAWPIRSPELQSPLGSVGAPTPAAVPDIESLRRAALQASWRRDRRVAKRRTIVRWALWYGIRGLPMLLVAAGIAIWLVPQLANRPTANMYRPASVPAPAEATASPAKQPGNPAAVQTSSPYDEPSIQLKLEIPFQPTAADVSRPAIGSAIKPTTAPITASTASEAASMVRQTSSPQLKPDNWLHSKEP